MSRTTGFAILREKVPELRSPWKAVGILTTGLLLFLGLMAFLWWFDALIRYGAVISQSIAVLAISILLLHSRRRVGEYRAKYGKLAYRYLFFRYLFVLFVIWGVSWLHVLIVGGRALLPLWMAWPLGLLLLFIALLSQRPAVTGGFDLATDLWVYTVFPEEGRRLEAGVYTFLRHPHYASGIYSALGFALLRNNLLAFLTALLNVVPVLVLIRDEDKELVERFGEEHRRYIREAPALFPHLRDLGSFARLLFFGERRNESVGR
jgi:protein-S-isoprenylcysteine O-methyltransferase Ste14